MLAMPQIKMFNPSFTKYYFARKMTAYATAVGFPPSRSCLWDSNPIGANSELHISSKHLLVCFRSAPLLSAWKHACHLSRTSVSCFFIARTQPTQDERVTLEIDRFDPGRTDGLPTSLLPSDLAIACDVLLSPDPVAVSHLLYNLSTFHEAFNYVTESLCTVTSLDVGRVLVMKVCLICSYERIHSIEFACILPEDSITTAPIRDIPIVPTALARNLTTSLSLSALQGQVKHGYITMDACRKLLLLLHSDPKANQLPLVGIWLSGVSSTTDVSIWMACVQYCTTASHRDTVWHEDGGFLALIFTSGATNPVLLHCRMRCTNQFELGHTKVFPKEIAVGGSVCFDLEPVASSTSLHTLFMAAKQTYSSGGIAEGPLPSPQPSPHPSEAPSLIKGAHLLSVSLPCTVLGTSMVERTTGEMQTYAGGSSTSKGDQSIVRHSQDGNNASCFRGSTSYSSNRGAASDERGVSPCVTDTKQEFDWSILVMIVEEQCLQWQLKSI